MSYYPWQKRRPRKYLGTPQWTLEKLFITPFTARRKYDEDGEESWVKIEPRLQPSGVEVMDHYLRRLTEGKDKVDDFCAIYGLRSEDLDSLIFILTGMKGVDFRQAYQLKLADVLLRYTDMNVYEIAERAGFGSHTNLCVIMKKMIGRTPTERRNELRQRGDAGRYRI